MPFLPFEHPQTKERRDFFVNITETDATKFRQQTDETGIVWKRILEVPMMSTDTQIDPFNDKDYVRATGNKKGTVGDLFDKSAELSAIRAEKVGGKDPVKSKFYDDWAKKHPNQQHPEKKKEDANEKLKPFGIKIT